MGTAVADMAECTESYNPREPFQREFALRPPKEKAAFFSSRAIELLKQLYWDFFRFQSRSTEEVDGNEGASPLHRCEGCRLLTR